MKQTDLEKLLADMSLKEKVDQMLQLSGAFYLGDENSVLTGPANDMGIGKEDLEMAGSILGAAGADTMKKLQDDYMAKQPIFFNGFNRMFWSVTNMLWSIPVTFQQLQRFFSKNVVMCAKK